MTDDDQGWVERSLKGDDEAFETLVSRYQHMIYTLSYRMTGSAADAEDLTQETFIRAHRQLAGFRADAKFSSWLYRIAVNQCLNWRKHAARRDQLRDDWQVRHDGTVAPDHSLLQTVQEALLKLNPKQRAAIVLTIYDGLSHAEAARALGCSETTVSWRVFTARAKLKRLFKKTKPGSATDE